MGLGADEAGQLGDYTLLDRWAVVCVVTPGASFITWLQVSADANFSIALRTAHTLWA